MASLRTLVWLLLALLVLSSASCRRPSTYIHLRVCSDMPHGPAALLTAVRVTVLSGGYVNGVPDGGMVRYTNDLAAGGLGSDAGTERPSETCPTEQFVGSLNILPLDSAALGAVTLEAEARHGGATLFATRAVSSYVRDQGSILEVFLADRCRDPGAQSCPMGQTCGRLGCEPVQRAALPSVGVYFGDDAADRSMDAVLDRALPDAPADALPEVLDAGPDAADAQDAADLSDATDAADAVDAVDAVDVMEEPGACTAGSTRPCYTGPAGTQGAGVCRDGVQVCGPSLLWGACFGQVLPAPEQCNGLDDDCNGRTDEGFGQQSCGLGACAVMQDVCVGGRLRVCVPGTPTAERCNGVDDNCNGVVDDPPVSDGTVYYADYDGDGFGTSTFTMRSCTPIAGWVTQGGDCNPFDPLVYPGAPERCNGVDDDCDGTTDNNPSAGGTVYFRDRDGDGYGDSATTTRACTLPAGSAAMGGDCDDNDSTRSPGRTELCDGVDNNCDSAVDNNPTGGGAAMLTLGVCAGSRQRCVGGAWVEPDYTALAGYRAGPETLCDLLDNNCNGTTDEGLAQMVFTDSDRDGFGAPGSQHLACPGPGTATNASDCNDGCASCHPGGTEVCDGMDNNCDGMTDEGLRVPVYADSDRDGYGSGQTLGCPGVPGFATQGGDCDDSSALRSPGVAEVCDGVDNNCDGVVDRAPGLCPANQWCLSGACADCNTPAGPFTLSGVVMSDLLFCPSTTPVTLTGSVVVAPGVRVVFMQGITVLAQAGSALAVQGGHLDLVGTAGAPVTFQPATATTAHNYWQGVVVNNSGSASAYQVNLSNAQNGLSYVNVADTVTVRDSASGIGVYATYGSARNLTLLNCDLGAILSAGVTVTGITVRNSSSVGIIQGDSTLTNATLTGCFVALRQQGTTAVSNALFTGNRTAVEMQTSAASASISNSTFYDNQVAIDGLASGSRYGMPTLSGVNFCAGPSTMYLLRAGNPPQNLPGNYWCTTDPVALDALLYDARDDATLGLLTYAPLRSTRVTTAPCVTGIPGCP